MAAADVDEVIIEVALNGFTTKATNPTVPRAPAEIAEQASACIAAGAAIVHSHPESQSAEVSLREYVDAWGPVVEARPDALLYPTARLPQEGETAEAAWSHNVELAELGLCRMSLVDPGSVNLGMAPDGTVDGVFLGTAYVNTHADNLYRLDRSRECGLGPSMSIFDPTFLRSALGYAAAGRVPRGAMFKLYFGEDDMFGLRATEKALDAYLELLEETDVPWSVGVLGGDVFADGFAELVLERGGHLRVGLEDLNMPGTRTNVELVEQAVALVAATGRSVASPARTAELLGLPPRPTSVD